MNAIALSFDRRLVPSHVRQSMNSSDLEEREQFALWLGIDELWEIKISVKKDVSRIN